LAVVRPFDHKNSVPITPSRHVLSLHFSSFTSVPSTIWPVKIVPDMTYNVFGETLNPTLPTLPSTILSEKDMVSGMMLKMMYGDERRGKTGIMGH